MTLLLLLVVGSAQAQSAGTAVTHDYVLTDLGTLGGRQSEAAAINHRCQIVGWSKTAFDFNHAFLWENGVMMDLGTLGGADDTFATDINNRGQIVGSSRTAAGEEHAFLWENGVMTDLGTLGGNSSFATGINERQQVVGSSRTAAGEEHAFLWENGVMTDLGTLGGNSSFAGDINDRGQVIGGSSTVNGEQHAVLWENGVLIDLRTLDGRAVDPRAINNRSQFVGEAVNNAFIGEHGVMTLFPLIGLFSEAFDVSNRGQTVGYDQLGLGIFRLHAVLWEPDGSIHDLDCLGGSPDGCRSAAEGIDDSGQIVGWSTGNSFSQTATLWEPVLSRRPCMAP